MSTQAGKRLEGISGSMKAESEISLVDRVKRLFSDEEEKEEPLTEKPPVYQQNISQEPSKETIKSASSSDDNCKKEKVYSIDVESLDDVNDITDLPFTYECKPQARQ